MAYDEELTNRLREELQGTEGLSEKRMFGGLAFMIHGNMAVAASGQGGLLLRIDPAQCEALLDEPVIRRFEMRGRELNGWLRVDPAAIDSDDELAKWVAHGVDFARSLPRK